MFVNVRVAVCEGMIANMYRCLWASIHFCVRVLIASVAP